MTSTKNIRFDNTLHKDFSSELKRKVDYYFKLNNINCFANAEMKVKAVIMVSLLITPYIVLLLFPLPFPWMLLLGAISGIGMVGVGFNISHDACHNALSSVSRTNLLLGYSFNVVGISAYLWKIKHNLSHHTYTNIYHHDEDLLESDNVRLSPDAAYKPIHRFQHIYYFLFYPLYSIMWIFSYDLQIFFRFNGNGSSNPNKKHPRSEVIIFIVSKIAYVVVAMIVPLLFMHGKWWEILLCFLTMHSVAGVIMACVVKLGHIVDNVKHFRPNEKGVIENSWMVHELETSSNFSMNSKFITWFSGGLNFQIEHHLFPGICSVHYSKINPIVKEVTKKYNLPYNFHETMIAGLRSHYRNLKYFGSSENTLEVKS